MDDFAVKFDEIHWDRADRPVPGGGHRKVAFVEELDRTAEEGQPAVVVLYDRRDDGVQNMQDWRLLSIFFADESEISSVVNEKFARFGMNRRCGCWAVSRFRSNQPMILLFNHQGKLVRQISSAQYDKKRLLRELDALHQLAERDRDSE